MNKPNNMAVKYCYTAINCKHSLFYLAKKS